MALVYIEPQEQRLRYQTKTLGPLDYLNVQVDGVLVCPRLNGFKSGYTKFFTFSVLGKEQALVAAREHRDCMIALHGLESLSGQAQALIEANGINTEDVLKFTALSDCNIQSFFILNRSAGISNGVFTSEDLAANLGFNVARTRNLMKVSLINHGYLIQQRVRGGLIYRISEKGRMLLNLCAELVEQLIGQTSRDQCIDGFDAFEWLNKKDIFSGKQEQYALTDIGWALTSSLINNTGQSI